MIKTDNEAIIKKIEELRDSLQKLQEFHEMDKNAYISDYHNYGLAEHYMQQALEKVLDISRHLVLSLEFKMPDDSHNLFSLLAKAKILSAEFVKRNTKLAGFRNRLVHDYDEIDHQKTYEYLRAHMEDLRNFIKQVSKYILKQSK